MFSVEVALSPIVTGAEFREHCLYRWVTEFRFAEQSDDIRFPSAIHTPPAVSFKTNNPKSAMVGIVSALVARAATFVMLLLALAAM